MLHIPDYAEIMQCAADRGNSSAAPGLWTGLAGWWPMQEGGGLRAFDVSGYGRHGTLTNVEPASDWIVTDRGHALSLGTDDWIDTGSAWPGAVQWTISIECFPTSSASFQGVAQSQYAVPFNTANVWGCIYWNANAFEYWSLHSVIPRISSGSLSLNTWYRCVLVNDLINTRMYVNGVQRGATYNHSANPNPFRPGFSLGRRDDADPNYFAGRMQDARVWFRALTPAEVVADSADPGAMGTLWRRVWPAAVASTPVSLSPDSATHAHAADSPAIVQAHQLAPADATHGHAADAPAIVQQQQLAPADCLHGHTADAPAIVQAHQLAPADCLHGHAADAPAIVQAHSLAPADCLHAHTAGASAIVQAHQLAPADCLHGHTADAPAIVQAHQLAPADCLHGHTADAPAIVQAHQLAPADCLHAHAADAPAIVQAQQLAPADCLHGHTADASAIVQQQQLAPADCLHAHAADAVGLTSVSTLAPDSATHAHVADAPAITQHHSLAPASCSHAHAADAVDLSQLHQMIAAACLHAHAADSPTLSLSAVPGPYRVGRGQIFRTGAIAGDLFIAGAVAGQTFRSGARAGDVIP